MTSITSDLLRDIAVRCTEQFLNDKVPLSLGLAKQASEYGLNSDQVQRCVEATNTVAFLKVKSMSPDKTCEFPLAKYAEVMGAIALPDEDKTYSDKGDWGMDFTKAAKEVGAVGMEKVACTSPSFVSTLTAAESHVYFTKLAGATKSHLSDLEVESIGVFRGLTKLAKKISEDPKGLDKMAQVMSKEEYLPLSALVAGEPQSRLDVGDVRVFSDFATADAVELSRLYKQAQEIIEEKTRLSSELEKVAEYDSMVKSAAVGGMFGGQKGVAENTVNKGFIQKGLDKIEQAGAPRTMLGRGVQKAVSVPAGAAAWAAKQPINVAADAGRKVGESVVSAAGKVADKVGLNGPSYAAPELAGATKVVKGIGRPLLGVATDAAMYHPGYDKTTGASRDVWDALS